MKKIQIPKNPPREIKKYFKQIDFKRGLKGYYFFAVIFLLTGQISFIAIFIPPYEGDLAAFKILGWVFFSLIGAGIIRTKNQKLDKRLKAFADGKILKAKITAYQKVFVPYKSFRDVIFYFEFESDREKLNGSFQTSNQNLIQNLPNGTKIDILFDNKTGSLFVPQECGVEIEN